MSIVEETTSLNENVLHIKEFLQNVLVKMELADCSVEVSENGESVIMNIVGEDASHAIGYRGETLDALQYLCNLLLNTSESGFKRVTLDAENYRSKREKILQRLASNMEQKVKRSGKASYMR